MTDALHISRGCSPHSSLSLTPSSSSYPLLLLLPHPHSLPRVWKSSRFLQALYFQGRRTFYIPAHSRQAVMSGPLSSAGHQSGNYGRFPAPLVSTELRFRRMHVGCVHRFPVHECFKDALTFQSQPPVRRFKSFRTRMLQWNFGLPVLEYFMDVSDFQDVVSIFPPSSPRSRE